MRSNTARAVEIGQKVIVHDFGHHNGVITGRDPVITIQNRTFEAKGWLTVRLDDGREWNGEPKLVSIR